jgi:hypothetical protein
MRVRYGLRGKRLEVPDSPTLPPAFHRLPN